MCEYILSSKSLEYIYPDGTMALKGVNVKFKSGETTAVLGGNGAGKSTLFMLLNGILKPNKGEVTFNDKKFDYSRRALKEIRKSVGIVFQDPDNQLFSASVYQDISFGVMNLKLDVNEVERRVEKAMKETGIYHLKDRPTHSLSYGQKKRVAIAGVIAMEPKVLILDEPTAGLDPMGAFEIMSLLEEIKREKGISIIISTHDIDLVPLYCSYVYVLNQGSLEIEGSPKEVFSQIDKIRGVNLRLPRIAHLMEILKEKDGFSFNETPLTISSARKEIRQWRDKNIK